MQNAIDSSSSETTIRLTGNIDGTGKRALRIPSGKKIILDLNGFTIDRKIKDYQDDVHLYNHGDSHRFYLTKSGSDSYNIRAFNSSGAWKPSPGYFDLKDNNVHTKKGDLGSDSKKWQFILLADRTYWVRNVSTGKFWALKDNKTSSGTKLVQSKTPQAWEMDIVATKDRSTLCRTKEKYDSYTFIDSAGNTVTTCNWMTFLPDSIWVTDISMPGVHDAVTQSTDSNHYAQCQQLSVQDMLYGGIRYFDLRFGMDGSGNLRMVQDGGVPANDKLYEFLKAETEKKDSIIWRGRFFPLLEGARGKVILMSRMDVYGDKDYKIGSSSWCVDIHNWNKSKDYTTELVTVGTSFEIWDQDDYYMPAEDKWKHVTTSVFDAKVGAEARIAEAESWLTRALVVSYTSGNFIFPGALTPQDMARWINPELYDMLQEWKYEKDNFGKRLGVVVSDFSDSNLARAVYMYNYDRYGNVIVLKTAEGLQASMAGTTFGNGALLIAVSSACAIGGFAAGYAVKRAKVKKAAAAAQADPEKE